jgi:drug/metabolite transporter (DMT)-like permease
MSIQRGGGSYHADMPLASPPERKNHLDLLAVSLLMLCCLLWGGQQVLIKATLPELPAVFQAWLRLGGATLLVLLWCLLKGISLWGRDGSLGAGLLAGLFFAGEFACIYVGLQHTSASRLTVFLYTAPFWVALLLPLKIPAERLHGVQWLGLALAFAAVVFALREGLDPAQGQSLQGDLLGLAAGMFWGLTTLVIRGSKLAQISTEKLLFYQVGVSAVLLPVLSLALGEVWVWPPSAFAWGSVLAQATVGGFVSFLIWMWMLGRYPATRMSSFVFFTPLFALLFGAWWLDETVTPGVLVAIGAVAAGMALMNRKAAG